MSSLNLIRAHMQNLSNTWGYYIEDDGIDTMIVLADDNLYDVTISESEVIGLVVMVVPIEPIDEDISVHYLVLDPSWQELFDARIKPMREMYNAAKLQNEEES